MVLAQAAHSGYLHSSSPLQIECGYDDEMCEDIIFMHDLVPSYYSCGELKSQLPHVYQTTKNPQNSWPTCQVIVTILSQSCLIAHAL